MVALTEDMIKKIKSAQDEVEPLIVDMLMGLDESNCPFRLTLKEKPDLIETRETVTTISRMLYEHKIMDKLDLSFSDSKVYDTILYAFGYWGGKTLNKHKNEICNCKKKCY